MEDSNLIVIMTDQHNKNMLGCYGNSHIETPNIDRLAENGVRFENAYCNSPVCVPSRASIATGNYASQNEYWDNAFAYDGKVPSWGSRLKEQGYAVTTMGKLHYVDSTAETGFADQKIPLHIKEGKGDVFGAIRDSEITRPLFREVLESAGVGETDYNRYDRSITEQAVAFLRDKAKAKDHNKPFVLNLGYVSPHFPLQVPQKYFDLYPDSNSVQTPVQFKKDDWPDHPVINDYRRYCATEDIDEDTAYRAIRAYYALCTFVDEQVGIVLDALKESGLEKNTRIIYTSDHGDTMGEHGLYFKSTMYEGSCGVPFIVSGPDLPKGEKRYTNISLVDLYPSIIECVGAERNKSDDRLPGESIWKHIEKENLNRTVFSEYYSFGIYTATFMVRKGPYKYIHYVNESPQLFDIDSDPNETNDLALDDGYINVLTDMEKELRKIVNPELMEEKSKKAQAELLLKHGGREKVIEIEQSKKSVFSPIPKI